MTALAHLVAIMLAGQAVIFGMVTFINGQLLPQTLAGVYDALPPTLRLLILVPIAAIPANWLVATGYRIAGPGAGGVAYVITAVLAMVTVAVLVDGVRLNWQIVLGTLAMAASGALVVRGLAA